MSYTVQKVNESELIDIFKTLNVELESETVYIFPESVNNEQCLINEYAPDFSKDLMEQGFNVKVLRSESYQYYVTKSADVIMPLLIGIPFSVFANFITDWLKANYYSGQEKSKIIKFRYYNKNRNNEIKLLEMEGNSEDLAKIINELNEKNILD